LVALSALFFVIACGADTAGTGAQSPIPAQPLVQASPADMSPAPLAPTPTPSPRSLKPVVAPAFIVVSFSGLMTGTYPVHLHSACNGSQSFHIAVVQSLTINQGGRGSISVASSSFGRGLCLIVYGSSMLRTVVAVRRI
jgi:hypothetical protein